ncbi:MAG: putative conserved domain protein, partial [uncultured Frankineae bacterium]
DRHLESRPAGRQVPRRPRRREHRQDQGCLRVDRRQRRHLRHRHDGPVRRRVELLPARRGGPARRRRRGALQQVRHQGRPSRGERRGADRAGGAAPVRVLLAGRRHQLGHDHRDDDRHDDHRHDHRWRCDRRAGLHRRRRPHRPGQRARHRRPRHQRPDDRQRDDPLRGAAPRRHREDRGRSGASAQVRHHRHRDAHRAGVSRGGPGRARADHGRQHAERHVWPGHLRGGARGRA